MINYIYIDSSQLDTENHYRFRIILNEKIKINKYIKLISATLPFDSQLIDSDNNSFKINSTIYTIPEGSYTLDELLLKITNLVRPNLSNF